MKKYELIITILIFMILPGFANAADWRMEKQNLEMNPIAENLYTSNNGSYKYILNQKGEIFSTISDNGILYFSEYHSSDRVSIIRAISIYSGKEIWFKQFDNKVQKLIINGDKIFIGSDRLYALNKVNGEFGWQLDKDDQGVAISTATPLAIVDDYLFVTVGISLSRKLNVYNIKTNNYEKMGFSYPSSGTDILADDTSIYIIYSANTFVTRVDGYSRVGLSYLWSSNTCGDNSTYSMLDDKNNVIYVGTDSSKFCGFSTEDGAKLFDRINAIRKGFVAYGDKGYGFQSPQYKQDRGYFKWFSLSARDGFSPNQSEVISGGEIFESDPVVVDGVLYGGTNLGRLWAKDLESQKSDIWPIDEDSFNIKEIISTNGRLVITSYDKTNGSGAKLFIFDANQFSLDDLDYDIDLISPYKDGLGYKPFLGQTHSHYIPDVDWMKVYRSDIWRNPAETVEAYRRAGYDFMALTEHNKIVEMPLIAGILQIQNAEEDTQKRGGNHILALGITELIDEDLGEQERINQINAQGGYSILAHPNSKDYPWSLKSVCSLKNYNTLEIINNELSKLDELYFWGSGKATDKWDKILSKRKVVWGAGGDDYTPGNGGFDGAGVVVFAQNLTQVEIMENLKNGNFYALQGSKAPRITIKTEGNKIIVSSNKIGEIKFIGNGGKTLQKSENVLNAVYEAKGDEVYVRAEVKADKKKSWSQPIFISKNISKETESGGRHYINFGQAKLISTNESQIKAEVLSNIHYPDESPPLGYFSDIYSFESLGAVGNGTKLAIQYDKSKIMTNAENLSIYVYNQTVRMWEKVSSFIDKENSIVLTSLDHFSLYTLSADEPEDTEKPTLQLLSPKMLSSLDDVVDFEVKADDNNAVLNVDYYLNDTLYYSDSEVSDGWIWHGDLRKIAQGSYELKVIASDLSGNVGEAKYDINITNEVQKPYISILKPTAGEFLSGNGAIKGSIESAFPIESVNIFIDGVNIKDTILSGNTFESQINWDEIVKSKHILSVEATDAYGNVSNNSIEIYVKDTVFASIISPNQEKYGSSDRVNLLYKSDQHNEINAYLDGQEIENNTTKYGFELELGKHQYMIMYDDICIDKKEFAVEFYEDEINTTIGLLYKTRHIKVLGISKMLIVQFEMEKRFRKNGWLQYADKIKKDIVRGVNMLNQSKVQIIDDVAKEYIDQIFR